SGKLSSTGNYIIEVSATSQSNYLISMNISALMQKKATLLIEKWLNAKQRMLAAPYDQQLVSQLATGKKLKDTIDSIKWLKSNSAYYEYEFSKLESLEYVKSSPGKAVFDATVVEKMILYVNGKIDKGNTTDYPRSKKYRFYLTFDQGFWKIEDSNYLSSE
ncbi:MAG: ARC6/PARC6 family protein, partial [Planktothrix sp.]